MDLHSTLAESDWEFVMIWMKTNDKQRLKQPAALPASPCFVFKLLHSFIMCELQMWLHKDCKEPLGEIWGFEVWKAGEEHKLSCSAVLKETSLIDNLLLLRVLDGVSTRAPLRYACFLCWPGTDNNTSHPPDTHRHTHTLAFTGEHDTWTP